MCKRSLGLSLDPLDGLGAKCSALAVLRFTARMLLQWLLLRCHDVLPDKQLKRRKDWLSASKHSVHGSGEGMPERLSSGHSSQEAGLGALFRLPPYPIYTVYTPSPWAGITLGWSSFCPSMKTCPQAQPEVYFNLLGNSKSSHADQEGEPSRYSDWMKKWNACDWKLSDCTLSDFKMAF